MSASNNNNNNKRRKEENGKIELESFFFSKFALLKFNFLFLFQLNIIGAPLFTSSE